MHHVEQKAVLNFLEMSSTTDKMFAFYSRHMLCCCCVLVCAAKRWGRNCENDCRCEESVCDKATGCTSCGDLNRGWTGSNCDEDINECENATSYCGANSVCTNTNGSFTCDCFYWYQRVSGQVERCECKTFS